MDCSYGNDKTLLLFQNLLLTFNSSSCFFSSTEGPHNVYDNFDHFLMYCKGAFESGLTVVISIVLIVIEKKKKSTEMYMNLLLTFNSSSCFFSSTEGPHNLYDNFDHFLIYCKGAFESGLTVVISNVLIVIEKEKKYTKMYMNLTASCYFTSPGTKPWDFIEDHRNLVEMQLIVQILNDVNVRASDLDELREQHQDLLADYHCIGKP
ncbi:hypothetical protein BaRGS_00009782, partial [Batillaria attramentaria]